MPLDSVVAMRSTRLGGARRRCGGAKAATRAAMSKTRILVPLVTTLREQVTRQGRYDDASTRRRRSDSQRCGTRSNSLPTRVGERCTNLKEHQRRSHAASVSQLAQGAALVRLPQQATSPKTAVSHASWLTALAQARQSLPVAAGAGESVPTRVHSTHRKLLRVRLEARYSRGPVVQVAF